MPRIDRLKEFLEDDPNDAFSRYALALEYIKIDCYTEALDEFETVIQNDGNYIAVYYQLAKAYEHEGRLDNAERTYRSGMDAASRVGDTKTMEELSQALQMLLGA